ncbi:hypothetical protein C2S52_004321 [Perilla frutescens var. hirtella]|nr:hypothetical protein C2S51_011251 [Perilla frutescens var. frutescens]KAH6793844.1 hypothetical protein C2S52_004321 [Perilla frutescens var. hirtella]
MSCSHKKIKCSCPVSEQILEEKSYDWLSNLPTDILYHILSFLDITEVVKTTFLSRKWRDMWDSMPCFNFNFRDFCDQEHCLALSYDECLSQFWAFVKWTFIMKNSSPICKLQFSCDYFDGYQLELLFSLCAMGKVQELELIAGYEIQQCPLNWLVPKHVAAFTENISSLVKLQSFTVFGNLKTLHLVRVQFPDAYIAEKVFSDCGVLENLSLEYCCFMMIKFLNIYANKLRKLNFVNLGPGWWGCKCIFEGRLKLHTPNLVSFSYIGPVIQLCEFSDMLFLKHASIIIHCSPTVLSPELGAMGLGIHHVEELSVSAAVILYFSPAFGRPGRNFHPFGNLRCLKLDLECTAVHIEGLINLLQLSPNLEVLRIELFQGWIISGWESREMDVQFLSHNLKEIEIGASHEVLNSVELIKFFLQNGKSLERIKFVQKYKKVNPEKFYALHEVQLASEAVSVYVTSISASGKREFFEFIYGKCGVSVQTKTSKMKIRIRRSMRLAGKKAGGSS